MFKFPLQYLWLHSVNYWFGFNVYNGTYDNYGKLVIVVYARYYTISLCAFELLQRQLYTYRCV